MPSDTSTMEDLNKRRQEAQRLLEEIEIERNKIIARGRENAVKELAALVKDATDSLKKAEVLATEYDLHFSFHPAYGMGGNFYKREDDDEACWHSSSSDC